MSDQKRKFQILRSETIPLTDIEPHPDNPRPSFHMEDDDPWLLRLGEAIKVEGQHRPAVVYERVGGWRNENEPGKYRLYQGERRYRASLAVGMDTLVCEVVATPEDEAEEWDWLGAEEAFKQDWQPFFLLRYCQNLADRHGIPVYSQEVSAKTGVSMGDLKVAEKVFKLEEPIQFFAAEYEEMMYQQLTTGKRRPNGRLAGTGIRTKESPVSKAAAVYDIFEALRQHTPALVKKFNDLDLQLLIAQKATNGATLEDLQKLHGQIKQLGKNPPPGLLAEISDLINNNDRKIKDTIKATGVEKSEKINQFISRANRLRKTISSLKTNVEQIASDPDALSDMQQHLLALQKDLLDLETSISRRRLELVDRIGR